MMNAARTYSFFVGRFAIEGFHLLGIERLAMNSCRLADTMLMATGVAPIAEF